MKPERQTLRRTTLYVAGASVLLAGVALALGGGTMAIAAAAGGVLAIANWLAMSLVGHRMLVASDKGRAIWSVVLAVKMAALLGVTWAVLSTGWVDPTGFAIGLSALVLGAISGTLHTSLSSERAARGAEEQVTAQAHQHAAFQAAFSGSAPANECPGAYSTYVRRPSADVNPDQSRLESHPPPAPERLQEQS